MVRCALFALVGLILGSPTALVAQSRAMPRVFPGEHWEQVAPADVQLNDEPLREAEKYALTGEGSGCVIRHGRLVWQWGNQARRYDLKSTTKSIGVTALGLALLDGKLDLQDRVVDRHPSFADPPATNAETRWVPRITIRQLANQTAGFEKPGGFRPLTFEPGTRWAYSDGGPNWLAECITLAYRRDVDALMFERVFQPLGITPDDLAWRRNAYRPRKIDGIERREFGSGISANVQAMARLGWLYACEGRWGDRQIISADFVRTATRLDPQLQACPVESPEQYGKASSHYGLLWWNNADGSLANVPRDAYWSWGLYDSLILVIPSLDLVAARAGKSWSRGRGDDHYAVLEPFFEPLVRATTAAVDAPSDATATHRAGLPPSPVLAGIRWAPAETIARRAKGSDNWPLTWGADDRLYTAYGDGRGFEPYVPKKLSLGLATVAGDPPRWRGSNLTPSQAEARGDGASGRKASGLLMVDHTLYMWVRNAGNSQLGWSRDRGRSWTWADWKFTSSFGCPTFLNFGPNYRDSRDDFVYVVSQDTDSAYQRADRMVMARVHHDQLADRASYRFFAGTDDQGRPQWHADVQRRQGVLQLPDCYRSSLCYSSGLGRYLWCLTGPGEQPRFAGGLTICDAPEPWGPWTLVFQTERWDVGPGETSSIPTKWMSQDGLEFYLVFSGDDCFSVRQGKFVRRR